MDNYLYSFSVHHLTSDRNHELTSTFTSKQGMKIIVARFVFTSNGGDIYSRPHRDEEAWRLTLIVVGWMMANLPSPTHEVFARFRIKTILTSGFARGGLHGISKTISIHFIREFDVKNMWIRQIVEADIRRYFFLKKNAAPKRLIKHTSNKKCTESKKSLCGDHRCLLIFFHLFNHFVATTNYSDELPVLAPSSSRAYWRRAAELPSWPLPWAF